MNFVKNWIDLLKLRVILFIQNIHKWMTTTGIQTHGWTTAVNTWVRGSPRVEVLQKLSREGGTFSLKNVDGLCARTLHTARWRLAEVIPTSILCCQSVIHSVSTQSNNEYDTPFQRGTPLFTHGYTRDVCSTCRLHVAWTYGECTQAARKENPNPNSHDHTQ